MREIQGCFAGRALLADLSFSRSLPDLSGSFADRALLSVIWGFFPGLQGSVGGPELLAELAHFVVLPLVLLDVHVVLRLSPVATRSKHDRNTVRCGLGEV